MTDAAISAVFVDYKRVKTRKVHQIILEVPSETWAQAYEVLGEPSIDDSAWFALAKLEGVKGEKLKGGKLSQIAAMLCDEGGFREFAKGRGFEDASDFVRVACDVTSRAHLDHNEEAAALFRDLQAEYKAWLSVGD